MNANISEVGDSAYRAKTSDKTYASTLHFLYIQSTNSAVKSQKSNWNTCSTEIRHAYGWRCSSAILNVERIPSYIFRILHKLFLKKAVTHTRQVVPSSSKFLNLQPTVRNFRNFGGTNDWVRNMVKTETAVEWVGDWGKGEEGEGGWPINCAQSTIILDFFLKERTNIRNKQRINQLLNGISLLSVRSEHAKRTGDRSLILTLIPFIAYTKN